MARAAPSRQTPPPAAATSPPPSIPSSRRPIGPSTSSCRSRSLQNFPRNASAQAHAPPWSTLRMLALRRTC